MKEPKILHLLKTAEHQLHTCVTFILLWIASCDDDIHYAEREFIFRHMATGNNKEYEELLSIIKSRDFSSFILVCRAINEFIDDSSREAFLSLCITVAIADQRLAISEIHLLRFLSDMMNYSPARFKDLYKEITGASFPEPGDPSSINWWESRTKKDNKEKEQKREQKHTRTSSNMTYAEAHVILGLHAGASKDDVRRAYKRLVQAHHPDKFGSLGPDAAQAAHAMLLRIQEAYKVLVG